MLKIWNEGFWKKQPGDQSERKIKVPFTMLAPVFVLALLTIILGIAAEPFINISVKAADQLINPAEYIQAVLRR